jgi:long-chain acyl-CoA synthetase
MLVGEGRPFLTLLTVTRENDEKLLLERANGLLTNFPRWVRISKVIATEDPWSIENGLLTPTLKLKRPVVLARFKDAIDKAYASAGAASDDTAKRRD